MPPNWLCKLAILSGCLGYALSANSVMIIGHRGARGLAPENTLPGFAKAIQLGVDYVDMDIVMTADKVLVVYHDLTLNPNTTRDASGSWVSHTPPVVIKHISVKQLKGYDVGQIKPHTALFPDQQSLPKMIHDLGRQWWDAEDVELTPKQVQKAHQLGLKVAVWFWPEHHKTAAPIQDFIDMGVDAIITDRPDLILGTNPFGH